MNDIETPNFLICPITQDVFQDPYVAMDGITYEKSAIEKWLQTNNTSPSFNTNLPSRIIVPNIAIRAALDWHNLSKSAATEPSPPMIVSSYQSRRQQALRFIQVRFEHEGWGVVEENEIRAFTLCGKEEYFVIVNSAPGDRYGYGDQTTRQQARLSQFGWGNKAVIVNIETKGAFVTTMGFHRYFWDLNNCQNLGLPKSDEYGYESGSKQDFTLGYTLWNPARGCFHKLY